MPEGIMRRGVDEFASGGVETSLYEFDEADVRGWIIGIARHRIESA